MSPVAINREVISVYDGRGRELLSDVSYPGDGRSE
jgi:hypothetical protein